LIFFIKHESKTRFPLFDPELLKIRLFIFPVISAAILYAALFIIIFLMPFYLTYPCGYSASTTGFLMITPFIFLSFISPVAGSLYDKTGSQWLCTAGMFLLTISLASFYFINNTGGVIPLLWRFAIAGMGTALFTSPNNTCALNSTSLTQRGIASGSIATARNMGMVIGIAIAGLIFSLTYSKLTHGARLENYTEDMVVFFMISFKRAMTAGAILAFSGIIVSYMRGVDKPST
jgi:MFS family permease